VRTLLETVTVAGSPLDVACTLYAIEGARSTITQLEPLWTMPGHLAQGGPLTSSAPYLVDNARTSVTCSTYNFQKSSGMWDALARAAARPEVALRVYVDTHAADLEDNAWTPTTTELAAHLHPAIVLRTKPFDNSYVRNHAKFLAVDHRFLLVTSANFSWSAEQGNVEFGVLIDNPNLAEVVERELRDAEDTLYERVVGHT
jgi:phosphatidylserine/phosphatidylglycerophosphate/cardiolipin synthase-like enzyme